MRPPLSVVTGIASFAALLAVSCRTDDRTPLGPAVRASAQQYVASSGDVQTVTDADQVLVEYTSEIELRAAVAVTGGSIDQVHPEISFATVSGLSDDQVAQLARMPGIKGATRDVIVQWVPSNEATDAADIQAVPDVLPQLTPDPTTTFFYAAFQWDMRAIRAQDAWPTGFQGQGAKVAILDTGIDDTHPELAGKVDHALSVAFTPNQNPAPFPVWGDDNLHGTHVASTVTGNLFAMASVAPLARLIAVKVLNRNGSGSFGNIIAGVLYATNVGANVINMSLGAYFPKSTRGGGPLNAALAKAVNYAQGHGVLVVCAAGNNGVNLDHDVNFVFVPAQSGTVFAVSATGPIGQANFDHLAHYSNFGRSGVDVAAPGGEFGQPGNGTRDLVLGACSRQTLDPHFAICRTGTFYLFAAGTSMASPHAAGVAALVFSRFGLGQTPAQVRTRLEQTADDLGEPGVDLFYSHGRINAGRAVNQ